MDGPASVKVVALDEGQCLKKLSYLHLCTFGTHFLYYHLTQMFQVIIICGNFFIFTLLNEAN
jgi:hypothetical protein